MPAVRQIGRRRFAWNLPLNEVRWTRSSPRTGGVLHAYPSIAKAAWQSRLSGSFYWPLPIIVFALVSILNARELAEGSGLARGVCGYIAVFWGVRLVLQGVF